MAVAAVVHVGGGGHARPWGEKAEEQGGERTRESESVGGRAASRRESRAMRGQQEVEAGGGASGARASTRLCLLAEVEDGGSSGGLGQLAGLPSGLHR